MTVLIVDDEPEYRLLLRQILMTEGYDVMTSENGEEALRKLSVVCPDIIVCDVHMPIMDGIKLHRSVRQMPQFQKLPFLFVSGYSDQYAADAVQDPRFDGFLQKGRKLQEVLDRVKYLTTPEAKRGKWLPG